MVDKEILLASVEKDIVECNLTESEILSKYDFTIKELKDILKELEIKIISSTGDFYENEFKNKIWGKLIVEKLIDGKRIGKVAEELNISRTGLYYKLREKEIQDYIISEYNKIECVLIKNLTDMANGKDDISKRFALKELNKIYTHINKTLIIHEN